MAKPNLTVAKDAVITVDYTLTLEDGEVVESTQGGMPLRYLAGNGDILPALEDSLMGLSVGDELNVVIDPEDGYGEYDEEAFEEVPADSFPADETLEAGMPIHVEDNAGEVFEAYISEVRDDTVVLDFNHPLAGETLHFKIKVIDVRPATAEELAHGHVHGDHGHGHDHDHGHHHHD